MRLLNAGYMPMSEPTSYSVIFMSMSQYQPRDAPSGTIYCVTDLYDYIYMNVTQATLRTMITVLGRCSIMPKYLQFQNGRKIETVEYTIIDPAQFTPSEDRQSGSFCCMTKEVGPIILKMPRAVLEDFLYDGPTA